MQVANAADFVALLEQSRLLSGDQLHRVREFSETSDNPCNVAKQIVQQGWLTRWQAQQLLAGRHKLFLGKYKLLENIGQGGMGAVLKAEHPGLGRIVALKVMAQELLQDPDAVARFLREIRSAAALNHPNIVTAYDADCVGNTYFLVMEYMPGDDLKAWIAQHQRLPVPWACECIRQAALGLQHAHESGLVHRDIKPSNLLIVDNDDRELPHVKILDMGLARFVSDTQEEGGLTRTGQIMGTPDYIAPEQGEDTHGADIRADIFSLGCTLFHAVTGQLPYSGNNVMEKLLARVRRDAPRIRALRPEVPAGLDAVVAKMLARDPADRYHTPTEVAEALVPFALGTMPQVTEPTILLQPERDQSPGKVEAKADATLNRFLEQLDNQAAETPLARRPQKSLRGHLGDRRAQLWGGGTVACFVAVILAAVFFGSGHDNGETNDQPPSRKRQPAEIIKPPPLAASPFDEKQAKPAPRYVRLPNGWTIGPPRNLGPAVNSTEDDAGPALSADSITLVFHSQRSGGQGGWDLWECRRSSRSAPWGPAKNLGATVNSSTDDVSPNLSDDGKTLVFGSMRPGGLGGFDFWMAMRKSTADRWGKPVHMGPSLNSAHEDYGPAFLDGGRTLVFHSNRPGGAGSSDLWESRRTGKEGAWTKPVNLGSSVNTPFVEGGSTVSVDGRTLIFGSDRTNGLGSADLWVSTRVATGNPWDTPVPLGAPLNSSFDDGWPHLSRDGRTLIFHSNRPGGEGGYDLYDATLSPPSAPGDHALSFDGKDDYVEIPSLKCDGSRPITIEATCAVTTSKYSVIAVGWEGDGIALSIDPTGKKWTATNLIGHRLVRYKTSETGMTTERATHLAAVFDGNQIQLFVDGRLQTSVGRMGSPEGRFFSGLVLGNKLDDKGKLSQKGRFALNGTIDEVRISKVARYTKDFTPAKRFTPDKDTLALYHFDEGQGDKLIDHSGNGHHGKIHGATWINADGTPINPESK